MFTYLVGEVAIQTLHNQRCGHAQTTSADLLHGKADIVDFVQPGIVLCRAGAIQPFTQTLGANTAGKAFTTRFMGIEGHGIVGNFDHIAAVIEDHEAGSAQHRSVAADAGFVQRRFIQRIACQKATRKAGHGNRLDRATLHRPAGPFIEQRPQGQPKGDFIVAGALKVAGEADDLRAGAIIEPEPLVPCRIVAQNLRGRSQRLDVVDRGREIVQTMGDGIGRPVTWERVLALAYPVTLNCC